MEAAPFPSGASTCTCSHFLSCLNFQANDSDGLSMFYVIQKEVEEQVKKAKSIFEFSAKDIQGNDVSLEKYR